MGEVPKPPSFFFSIVVVGPMNPRLHHPYWYEQIGAITEAERVESLNGEVVVLPMAGKFDVPSAGFGVTCQTDRWDIHTTVESAKNRLVEVASKVFEKLHETPVMAVGLNTHLHRPTTIKSVRMKLAHILAKTGLGLPENDPITSHIIAKSKDPSGYKVHVEVAPSPVGESIVLVTFNSEYQPPTSEGYFDLGKLVRERIESHSQRATVIAAQVVDGLRD
jgi:hypothetical protein